MSEVEVAGVIPAPRTRKPKDGAPRKSPRTKLKGMIEEGEPVSRAITPSHVYGYPVADGFARITVFGDPSEGNKTHWFMVSLGDHPKTYLAKNRNHVLPMGLVNNIIDTTQEFPVDDTSDERNPQRMYEMRARFPHSEPIPATAEEYVAYRKLQEKLIHPNKYKKL